MKLSCPSCGADVEFKSKASVFGVCPFCASTLVRHDINLETLGKMAELPPDVSPLQVGTRGRYENSSFEIVGRLKVKWAEGSWNEWFALLDDGTQGWLGEFQGFYTMSFQVEGATGIPPVGSLKPGVKVTVGKSQYQVDDIREIVCQGSEGELPFRAVKGRKSVSVDLGGQGETFASMDCSDDEGVLLYVGRYVDFDKFKFQSLREIDGW
jgi:predicted RNA-binding Zn-ribbon protein involved in translation (DUF1610 family)